MSSERRGMRNLGGWLLLLATSALSGGCLSFCHPIGTPPPAEVSACCTAPPCCRNHVYVFFLQGIDPLSIGNLRGVRDYVQSLGFIKTYYGQYYHVGAFAKEIRRLNAEDPHARFVLVGYNFGANGVCHIARSVRSDGIFVDLVVYLGDGTLKNSPETKPENVGHVVNIRTTSWGGNGPVLDDAVNVTYSDVSILGVPAHRTTLETLAHDLTTVAGMVTAADPHAPPPPVAVPVRQMPHVSAPPDEWDFLKPRSPASDGPLPSSAPPKPKEPAPPTSSIGRIS